MFLHASLKGLDLSQAPVRRRLPAAAGARPGDRVPLRLGRVAQRHGCPADGRAVWRPRANLVLRLAWLVLLALVAPRAGAPAHQTNPLCHGPREPRNFAAQRQLSDRNGKRRDGPPRSTRAGGAQAKSSRFTARRLRAGGDEHCRRRRRLPLAAATATRARPCTRQHANGGTSGPTPSARSSATPLPSRSSRSPSRSVSVTWA